MRKKIIAVSSALAMAVILSIAPVMTFLSQAQTDAEIQGKNEILYGNLQADGSINSIYAINQFTVKEGGNIVDFGDYSLITNLTTTNTITQDGETVSFDADPGTFYYQGNLKENNLPWIIQLTYTLNGIETFPDELAGKSGDLTIHLATKQNTKVNPVFYENYMLQASFSLGNDVFTEVIAEDANIASAGSNLMVNFTVMPGKDCDSTITAKVTDFHMDGVQISGIPFTTNVDFAITDDMLGDFTKLSDGIEELNSGIETLNLGASKLSENAAKLAQGSSDIKDAINQLSSNTSNIITGSSQIKEALSLIAAGLDNSSPTTDFSQITTLTETLTHISTGLSGISSGLTELNTGFSQGFQALDQAIMSIPDTVLTQEDINSLYLTAATDPVQKQSLDTLVQAYTSAMTVKGTYNQVKSGFSAVGSTITAITPSINETVAGLQKISDSLTASMSANDLSAQIGELISGLNQLSDSYGDFHKGLVTYMKGITTLNNGYGDFQGGLSKYSDGMNSFTEGVTTLYGGTQELKNQTSALPELIQKKIKETTEEYSGKNFEPVSFLSLKNNQINLVQFVMKTADIAIPEKALTVNEEQPEETFWDRLVQLFSGK